MLTFEQARHEVVTQISKLNCAAQAIDLTVWDAQGFVLAQKLIADRNYPPFNRATRDGYAVRASESTAGATLQCIGEIKAGDALSQPLEKGTCIQIMTGAPVPSDADAVVMIEYTTRDKDLIRFQQSATKGQNIVPAGSEGAKDQLLLQSGTRLGYAELSLAAQIGATQLRCAKKPRVAILSTGDEIVAIDAYPGPFQIRNSNSVSLAAQVREAGGDPVILGNASDRIESLGDKVQQGLQEDVLVLSGGVSMGKYDLVEDVLKSLGATFYFDAVAIRPGKPAVFAMCNEKPVFGLPGNPVSTMVTFQLFVVPAIDLLSGAPARPLPFLKATLAQAMKEKPGMTHFLPARVQFDSGEARVKALPWQGSGDTVTMAKANCLLVVGPHIQMLAAGENVNVLMRKDVS
ncbi:MAG TPA: gephyrin-like molybdotransferase Glp [Candidatus Acidoferrum sp.]|jgi:molybdopterin molybdotransferase|nr:gephyrin-like molybdotransferase Glp [Candidatus Acidoferrum sp.]